MQTLQHMRETIEAAERKEVIQWSHRGENNWRDATGPSWNWSAYDFRPKPPAPLELHANVFSGGFACGHIEREKAQEMANNTSRYALFREVIDPTPEPTPEPPHVWRAPDATTPMDTLVWCRDVYGPWYLRHLADSPDRAWSDGATSQTANGCDCGWNMIVVADPANHHQAPPRDWTPEPPAVEKRTPREWLANEYPEGLGTPSDSLKVAEGRRVAGCIGVVRLMEVLRDEPQRPE